MKTKYVVIFFNQSYSDNCIYNVIRETKNFVYLSNYNNLSYNLKISKKTQRAWIYTKDYVPYKYGYMSETAKPNICYTLEEYNELYSRSK